MDIEMQENLYKQFMEKTNIAENGCWNWQGVKTHKGYGRIWYKGRWYMAHRVSLALFREFDIRSDFLACHHCDNPSCVNPDHLFVGTHQVNVQDCIAKGRFKGHLNSPYLEGGPQGEGNPKSKLQECDIVLIRELFDNGGYDRQKLAKRFKVTPGTITDIAHRKYWNHI